MKILYLFLCVVGLEASMFHTESVQEIWEVEEVTPFSELILSWNGKRPLDGSYQFYISVKKEEWSPYLLYASWGSEGQSTYSIKEAFFKVFQDELSLLEGKATGFRIRIESENGADLSGLQALHVYTNGEEKAIALHFDKTIEIPFQGLSQMALNHEKRGSLCSPTSVTSVIRHFNQECPLDPIQFATESFDQKFQIFGNWALNVSGAFEHLGEKIQCWVEKFSGFEGLYQKLLDNTPVVVSVRGPLVGSAQPYQSGHLMVVRGYDAEKKEVLCMDPAFHTNEETLVSYPLDDFLAAWKRRENAAYVFQR